MGFVVRGLGFDGSLSFWPFLVFFFVVVKVFEDFRVRVLLGFLWWRNEKKQR